MLASPVAFGDPRRSFNAISRGATVEKLKQANTQITGLTTDLRAIREEADKLATLVEDARKEI